MFEDDVSIVHVEVVEETEEIKTSTPQSDNKEQDIKNDYEQTRKIASDLATDSYNFALEAMEMARAEYTPRAFEVAMNALKSAAEITEKLLTTHEKIANINSKKTPEERTEVKSQTNNFYLNTNDLLGRLLEKNQTEPSE